MATNALVGAALVVFSSSFCCLPPWSGPNNPNDPQQSYCTHLNGHSIAHIKPLKFLFHIPMRDRFGCDFAFQGLARIILFKPLGAKISFLRKSKTVNKNEVGPGLRPTEF